MSSTATLMSIPPIDCNRDDEMHRLGTYHVAISAGLGAIRLYPLLNAQEVR